uniref:Uncharacterized protein n=1 Tax=Peronospora matthiolae TaxID=2874970 RepID=A0AAV1TTT6_9STRA
MVAGDGRHVENDRVTCDLQPSLLQLLTVDIVGVLQLVVMAKSH